MGERHIHPAFPQPEDLSITLWRYMDFEKFVWLVTCSRLLMPRADSLGDRREGTMPPGDLEWWRRAARDADSKEHRRIIEYNRDFSSRWARAFRSNYYVTCWHMNEYENHAMWACYTTRGLGVAVKTTYWVLRDSLASYVEIGLVRYIDYSRERLPTMNMFEYIMHKEVYYEYEREVRGVASPPVEKSEAAHFRENLYESESKAGFIVYAPPVDITVLIKGVVLHPCASRDFEDQVRKLCLEKALPQPERSRGDQEPIY